MTPQFVDLNADGTTDLVAATFEGTAFFIEGTEDGFKRPEHILDENDELVRISKYWDLEKEEYLYVDRTADGEDYDKYHHMTSIALVDWDADEDLDLVLGAREGALYLCLNEGTIQEPKFSAINLQIKAGGEHLTLDGLATPRICDWDNDGRFDILCGGSNGGVFYYRNIGIEAAPEFAAAQTLIEKYERDGSGGIFVNVPTKDGLPTIPGKSFHIETVDYDADGDLDLLVGAQSYYAAATRELTNEEKVDLAETKAEGRELSKELSTLIAENDDEDLAAYYKSEEYNDLMRKYADNLRNQQELEPTHDPANFVWLYRNNGGVQVNTEVESDAAINGETRSTETSSTSSTESSANVESADSDSSETDSNDLNIEAAFDSVSVAPGDEVTLTVQINVPQGFHIYGSLNDNYPTTLNVTESGGLEAIGEAVVPEGRLVEKEGLRMFWLDGTVTLQQKMAVPEDFESAAVEGYVQFMKCNEEACDPPAEAEFRVTLRKTNK